MFCNAFKSNIFSSSVREQFAAGKQLAMRKLSVRQLFMLLFIPLILCLSSCGDQPEDRLIWSPDGSRAVFIGSDGLRLMDKKNGLSDIQIKRPERLCWSYDNQTLIVVTGKNLKVWGLLKQFINKSEQEKIEKSAARLIELDKSHNNLNDESILSKEEKEELIRGIRPGDLLTYINSINPTALNSIMKKSKIKSEFWSSDVYSLRSYKVAKNKLVADKLIARTREGITAMKLSPDGKVLAVVSNDYWNRKTSQLAVYPLKTNNSKGIIVDSPVVDTVAWCPQGKDIAYFKKDKSSTAGSALCFTTVQNNSGKVLDKFEPDYFTLASTQKIGDIVWSNAGSIFFSCVSDSYPRSLSDAPTKASLFMVEPDKHDKVIKMVDGEKTSSGCRYFDVCPSGKKAIILNKEGKIELYDFPGRTSTLIQSKTFTEEQFAKSAIKPRFKNNNEISFSVPIQAKDKDSRGAEIFLYSFKSGKRTNLSAQWPDSAVEFLKLAPKKETKKKTESN